MINVKPIGITLPLDLDIPDSEGIVSYCARVSNPNNQTQFDTAAKLLKYCVRNQHWSVFEMVNVVMEIECPRDIARQVLRHRSFSFQEFCISKDSLVKTDKGALAIEDLYQMQQSGEVLPKAKVYDEDECVFKEVAIKEVFDTGEKQVYELRLKSGKRIVSTLEHKFLTKTGFQELGSIRVGDFVGTNGVPCYQNKEWLALSKEKAVLSGGGLQQIATEAGTSTHTIRKWLRVHGLQFTKLEVASYTQIWNKGLPSEQQPMHGKLHSEGTRKKQTGSARLGDASNLWSGGVERGFRQEVWDWQYKCRNAVMKTFAHTCVECGATENLELDHMLPVKSYPEKAFDIENLQVLCKDCHKGKSAKEYVKSPNFSEVVSITAVGVIQTYDLEVDHASHNYVANGIVTHNSQRYAEATNFITRECRMQDTVNRQNSVVSEFKELNDEWDATQRILLDQIKDAYDWALSQGIAKECARVILPEGLTMSKMYMNGTLRSWLHYVDLRAANGTQKEHQEIAIKCRAELMKLYPFLEEFYKG